MEYKQDHENRNFQRYGMAKKPRTCLPLEFAEKQQRFHSHGKYGEYEQQERYSSHRTSFSMNCTPNQ